MEKYVIIFICDVLIVYYIEKEYIRGNILEFVKIYIFQIGIVGKCQIPDFTIRQIIDYM